MDYFEINGVRFDLDEIEELARSAGELLEDMERNAAEIDEDVRRSDERFERAVAVLRRSGVVD